jgi:hypothetical protein
MDAWTAGDEAVFCAALSTLASVTATAIDQLELERRRGTERRLWSYGLET